MTSRIIRNIPFNRVEGDLEVSIEYADGRVSDAWSAGTLYRGFENLMKGRGALDGLVMTPRICGICSTTHLAAAARALDAIAGLTPPDNAVRVRNVALMVEHMQSDVRHSVLMYMTDFAHAAHARHPLYDEALRRYAPAAGSSAIDTIRETKRLLEVIAMLGGQWPHSSFMVPGGIAFAPSQADVLQCLQLVRGYRAWYERRVLGCPLERWREVDSRAALDAWLDESAAHRDSETGFLLRFGREAGLDVIGGGPNAFLSYGSLDLPQETAVVAPGGQLVAAGFARGTAVAAFDATHIAEDVSHAWYRDHGTLHPAAGETDPYASAQAGRAYSWVKAPRYDGQAVETGPLAEAVIDGRPLFIDLVAAGRTSALARQLARLTRPATMLPAVEVWLQELLATQGAPVVAGDGHVPDGEGAGLVQAARGALGHWVRIENGRIARYQVITPTAWNGSPRDSTGQRGAWEEAIVGTPIADPDNPIEAGHVIRSFDPCLVCAVHTVRRRT
ncbi:MAG: nickel-dependent hydrogenase large subunit [Sulfuritalea sp.]|jgi:hydrogenase large subunit|nr:nickel-dependent hydrogenase large subunit [Sulfuritalea sp.]